MRILTQETQKGKPAEELARARPDAVLTDKLVDSGWVRNDAGRGFKLMQIYRSDCASSARIASM